MKVCVRNYTISTSNNVRNIGAYFDSNFLMTNQINNIIKSAWFQLRKIGQIRKYLDKSSAERLIHAFVSSRLDQNNSLLYGLPLSQIDRLQRLQNAAARMLMLISPEPGVHISPVLFKLHWLPVQYRIQFKLLLLVYKSLNNKGPAYLSSLLVEKNKNKVLRSNEFQELDISKVKTLKMYGDRAFEIAGPKLWNKFIKDTDMKGCMSVNSFKAALKTYLFKVAYRDFLN